MEVTREDLLSQVAAAGLDWGDEEDALALCDILLEGFTAFEVMTWFFMPDVELGYIPMLGIRAGHHRRVVARARKLVAEASSA